MKVQEIASHQVITLQKHDTIDKGMALMEEHGIRHLPVISDDSPIGMVSDRDLLSAVGWMSVRDRVTTCEGPAIVGPLHVGEIMATPVYTLSPDDSVEKAARLMLTHSISAIPLVRDGCLVSLVTETDFLKCFLDPISFAAGTGWRFWKVGGHMASHIFHVKSTDTTMSAIKLMQKKNIRHLPVTQNGDLVGIVSDRDIRKSLFVDKVNSFRDAESGARLVHRSKLEEVMTRQVETTNRSATLVEVANRMVERKIGALPVTNNRKLVGIITETDLLRAFLCACEA